MKSPWQLNTKYDDEPTSDFTTIIMTQKEFDDLPEYSCTQAEEEQSTRKASEASQVAARKRAKTRHVSWKELHKPVTI